MLAVRKITQTWPRRLISLTSILTVDARSNAGSDADSQLRSTFFYKRQWDLLQITP